MQPVKYFFCQYLSFNTKQQGLCPDSESGNLLHFRRNFNVQRNDINVTKLTPKYRDIATISFISFKVGCSSNCFGEALCSEKWPVSVLVNPFKPEKWRIIKYYISSLICTNFGLRSWKKIFHVCPDYGLANNFRQHILPKRLKGCRC